MYHFVNENKDKGKLRIVDNGPFEVGPWAIVDLDGLAVDAKRLKRSDVYEVTQWGELICQILNDCGYKTLLYTTRKISGGVAKRLHEGLIFTGVYEAKLRKIKDGEPKDIIGLMYFDNETLYFNPDDIEGSLPRFGEFMKTREVKNKLMFGITPREIVTHPNKYKWATQDYILGNTPPIHITSRRAK
jgi:hypothetical protein